MDKGDELTVTADEESGSCYILSKAVEYEMQLSAQQTPGYWVCGRRLSGGMTFIRA